MTILLSTIQSAAFWDRAVCLPCGQAQGDEHDPEDHDCDFCGSSSTHDAATLLSILAQIEDNSET